MLYLLDLTEESGSDPFVFLSEMQYSNLKVDRPGNFAANGTLGRFGGKIRIKGEESQHGLFLHPPAQGYSEVTMIDGKEGISGGGRHLPCDWSEWSQCIS